MWKTLRKWLFWGDTARADMAGLVRIKAKGDLYKTFQDEKVFGWKGLVKVNFNSPFLNQAPFP